MNASAAAHLVEHVCIMAQLQQAVGHDAGGLTIKNGLKVGGGQGGVHLPVQRQVFGGCAAVVVDLHSSRACENIGSAMGRCGNMLAAWQP